MLNSYRPQLVSLAIMEVLLCTVKIGVSISSYWAIRLLIGCSKLRVEAVKLLRSLFHGHVELCVQNFSLEPLGNPNKMQVTL